MLVLGIDPGFRSLGLALVDTAAGEVLATRTVDCGQVYYAQHKTVNRALEELFEEFPLPQRVATENVPNGFAGKGSGGRTACTMHWVLGGVGLWAAQHGIPMAGIAPKALKTFACKVIGVPYTSWKGAKGSRAQAKWGISEAVKVLTGSDESSSDHEADAVLAAFALHGAKLRP